MSFSIAQFAIKKTHETSMLAWIFFMITYLFIYSGDVELRKP